MKKWFKIIGGLAVIGILAALYVWFFVYNKPHRDYEKAEPDHIVAAEELYYSYKQDKVLSDSMFAGTVVQINGNLDKVETVDTTVTVVFAFEKGMFGDEGIRCILLPGKHLVLKEYNKGDPIHIKGYCTGYNDTDVILENASIVKTE